MPGRALLDTSAVVGLLRGDRSASEKVRSLDEAFTSIVVIGEPPYGARLSTSAGTNLALVASFASSITVLSCDAPSDMARCAGHVGTLRNKGTAVRAG